LYIKFNFPLYHVLLQGIHKVLGAVRRFSKFNFHVFQKLFSSFIISFIWTHWKQQNFYKWINKVFQTRDWIFNYISWKSFWKWQR